MSVTAAGSSINVQQALIALRQSVQQEQIAASLVTSMAANVAQTAQQDSQPASEAPSDDGRGEHVDVKA